MYDKAATTAGGGTLAATGAFGTLWMLIAAIAIVAAGAALYRMVPRKN